MFEGLIFERFDRKGTQIDGPKWGTGGPTERKIRYLVSVVTWGDVRRLYITSEHIFFCILAHEHFSGTNV